MFDFTEFSRELQTKLNVTEPRPLVSGTHINATIIFPSKKNNAWLACDSLLQAQACLYFEQHRETKAYLPRPFLLRGETSKVHCKPDVIAVNDEGVYSVYLLVRPDAPTSHMPRRMEVLEAALKTIPVRTVRLDLARFGSPARLHNLRYLYHHAYSGNADSAVNVVRLLECESGGQATIAALGARGASAVDITFALFHHLIEANLDRPLTPQTVCRAISHV